MVLATSLFGDLAARLYEDASAPLHEHPGSPRLLNLAPDPRAVGQVDLPAGDEELLETANPITECDVPAKLSRSRPAVLRGGPRSGRLSSAAPE